MLNDHNQYVKRLNTPKMMQNSKFLEDFRQSKFRETVSILNELRNLDSSGVSSLSNYQFSGNDDQYEQIARIRKEYKGGSKVKFKG